MHIEETLKNGIRVLVEEVPGVHSVALGFWVRSGSRHERPVIHGASHFLEHMMFKGTERRSARQIAEELETVGGQLNAFTTKEYTCYYARVLKENFSLAVDVLSDMLFHSRLDQGDVDKERGVILEEISLYEDSPDELVHDLFATAVWREHPLGKAVLGSSASVGSIGADELRAYYQERYLPCNMVVAVAGSISPQEALEQLRPVLEALPARDGCQEPSHPVAGGGNVSLREKDTEQVQLCIGTNGLSQEDKRIYDAHVLGNVLGGGLSSRLFQEVREERGLAYSIFSYHSAFSDTGLFGIYAGTAPQNLDQVLEVTTQELLRLRREGITAAELERTKKQVRGSTLMSQESVTSRMSRLGKTQLLLGRVVPIEEVIDGVAAVTPDKVVSLAAELFQGERLSLAVIGPLPDAPDWRGVLAATGL